MKTTDNKLFAISATMNNIICMALNQSKSFSCGELLVFCFGNFHKKIKRFLILMFMTKSDTTTKMDSAAISYARYSGFIDYSSFFPISEATWIILGSLITAGSVISVIPQISLIIKKRSSFGINPITTLTFRWFCK